MSPEIEELLAKNKALTKALERLLNASVCGTVSDQFKAQAFAGDTLKANKVVKNNDNLKEKS